VQEIRKDRVQGALLHRYFLEPYPLYIRDTPLFEQGDTLFLDRKWHIVLLMCMLKPSMYLSQCTELSKRNRDHLRDAKTQENTVTGGKRMTIWSANSP